MYVFDLTAVVGHSLGGHVSFLNEINDSLAFNKTFKRCLVQLVKELLVAESLISLH